MNAVKVTGHVDANHQLSAKVPATVPPGLVTVLIVPMPEEDEAGDAWMAGVVPVQEGAKGTLLILPANYENWGASRDESTFQSEKLK